MPISVEWGNDEKTLVVIHVSEPFSPDEFIRGIDQINSLMGTVDHPVSPAVDFTQVRELPMNALANYRRVADRMGHPNSTGRLFVIGARGYFRALLDVFSSLYRRINYADTLEEARKIIADG